MDTKKIVGDLKIMLGNHDLVDVLPWSTPAVGLAGPGIGFHEDGDELNLFIVNIREDGAALLEWKEDFSGVEVIKQFTDEIDLVKATIKKLGGGVFATKDIKPPYVKPARKKKGKKS